MSAVVRGLKTPKQVGKKMMRTGRMMLIMTTMQTIVRAKFFITDFRQRIMTLSMFMRNFLYTTMFMITMKSKATQISEMQKILECAQGWCIRLSMEPR